MTIDGTEVQPVNGVAHKRVRIEDVRDGQTAEQPSDVDNINVATPEPQVAPNRAERRRLRERTHAAIHHKHTRFALRHGAYVAAGVHVVAKRTWESRTTAVHQKAIDTARIKGDHASMLQWTQEAARFREQRHKRRMELMSAPYHLVKGTVFGGALTVGGLIALGIMLAIVNKDPRNVFAPLLDALRLVKFLWTVCGYLYLPVALSLPALLVGWLWANGKNKGNVPNWLVPESQRTRDQEVITPSIVVKALRDLGVRPLTVAIKEMADGAASMLSPITIAGCGALVDVSLPSGVSTADIQGKRRRLAENLGRHEHELFVTIPQAARTVRLWIADAGALDESIGESPIALDEEMTADFYTGRCPWGQTLRGDAALISLFQNMLLITGLSNQGKTAALRALALWLAHDVTVEFRMADLKGIGDWRCMDGIATVLIEGPTDENVIATTLMLEAMVAEMHRRSEVLKRSGTTEGITREMARRPGSGFHPIVGIVDEAQVAYMCPAVGEDKRPYGGRSHKSRYLKAVRELHNQGRALNVILWEGTQDPTNDNLPKLSREGNHVRASLAVGTEEQSRMALGDAAVDGGAAPHKLRQGLDKGKVVVTGGVQFPAGETSLIVRTHYIDGPTSLEISERVKGLRAGRRHVAEQPAEDVRDLLADIREVCGDEIRVQTSVVLQRLAALDARYEGFTGQKLKAFLESVGATPHKYAGNPVVTTARVQAALDDRENDDSEPEDDDF